MELRRESNGRLHVRPYALRVRRRGNEHRPRVSRRISVPVVVRSMTVHRSCQPQRNTYCYCLVSSLTNSPPPGTCRSRENDKACKSTLDARPLSLVYDLSPRSPSYMHVHARPQGEERGNYPTATPHLGPRRHINAVHVVHAA